MRHREDELFLQRITHDLSRAAKSHLQMIDLKLKDAPIRLRCAPDEVYDTPANPEDPAIEKIRKALTRESESGNLEALVLPLALGHHVDHLTTLAAALPFTPTLPSAFYEDLPYAATHPSVTTDLQSLREDVTERLHEPLTPTLTHHPQAAELKRHLALGYASQIEEETANLIADFATRYNGGERLWVNPFWLATFAAATT